MKQNIYLSVDMDFWQEPRDFLVFLNRLIKTGKEIRIFEDHHQMVPHINKAKCSTIINIDTHSDIRGIKKVNGKHKNMLYTRGQVHLDCGNWANYVDTRYYKKFIWRYPSFYNKNKFLTPCRCEDEYTLPRLRKYTDFKTLVECGGLPRLDLTRVKCIGVCISRPYLQDRMFPIIDEIKSLDKNHTNVRVSKLRHDTYLGN